MAVHEHLTPVPKAQLEKLGWSKARELAKIARAEGPEFPLCTWVHKAETMPREEFRREVDRHLTGRATEPWDMLYFKVYKSQLPVIEQALETAGLMLGNDRSRGYCLEMICADFLAGARLEDDTSEAALMALIRLFGLLTEKQKTEFCDQIGSRS
jgi:hypothetical protein